MGAPAPSGDHLHPNGLGYQAMGNAVPLELFRFAGDRGGEGLVQPAAATPG